MPKTQSALLEAMAERQVTVDGVTRPLPHPFFVIATENPIEQEGTFPLPEAQLDRFGVRATLGYPAAEEEVAVVREQRHGHPLGKLEPVVSADDVRVLQRAVEEVYVDDLLLRWIVDLVRATREVEGVATGASVRGSLALERTARAWALLHGREYVVPEDVETLFLPVLGHRILVTTAFLAETRGLGREAALERIRGAGLRAGAAPRAGLARGPAGRRRLAWACRPSRSGSSFRSCRTGGCSGCRSGSSGARGAGRARTSWAPGRTVPATRSARWTGTPPRSSPRPGTPTSSSSAPTRPTRRRGWCSSATAVPR